MKEKKISIFRAFWYNELVTKETREEKVKVYYLFSPALRVFHWVMAACIITLFVTGLLITKPVGILSNEPTNTVLSVYWVRNIHFLAAFTLCAAFILRVYGYATNKGDRLFPRLLDPNYYKDLIDVGLHYMFIKPTHKPYLRNPIARMSYAFLYFMLAVEILTGFAMYFMYEPDGNGGRLFGWVNELLGTEMMTHYVHHYAAWIIILFIIGHVYMVFRADYMEAEGEASSMISGVKLIPHTPADVAEIEDVKGRV